MVFQDIMSLPGKPTFILFILRQQAEEIRQQIKYTCDIVLGILNQCVVCIISVPYLARVLIRLRWYYSARTNFRTPRINI